MQEELNLCRCFLRSKCSHCFLQTKGLQQIQIREFTPCGACSQEGKMFQFSMGTQANIQKIFDQPECMLCLARLCYECISYISKLETVTCSYVLPVTYLHQVRGSQPIQNDTRYQPLKDSLLLHGLSFYGVIPTQRLEVWTDNASRSQISDNKRAQEFFF